MTETLDTLWAALSRCLTSLTERDSSHHTFLSLQNAAEAFFLANSLNFTSDKFKQSLLDEQPASPGQITENNLSCPEARVLKFANMHRTILNQILRSTTNNLENGAFSILINFPRLLDFDVKRKYFYKEIRKLDDRMRRHDDIALHIRRSHVFSDSFRELFRLRTSDWKARFYIIFEGEEGQDAGGLLREWYQIITREIFNPMVR
jgi:E3 ubiquitin-protein ligase HUWE1